MCVGVRTYLQSGCGVFRVVHIMHSVQDAVMCVCFLLLSSPSPSMVNGGMKKFLVQQSNQHLPSTSPRVVPHFPLTARSRCIAGELLLHVAGTVGSVLFTVQTCVSVCCTLLDKDKLTCTTSPSCIFACSPQLDPIPKDKWRKGVCGCTYVLAVWVWGVQSSAYNAFSPRCCDVCAFFCHLLPHPPL